MIQAPRVLSSGTLLGSEVVNIEGEKLGKVQSFAVDLEQGSCLHSAVLWWFPGLWR
jgi:sporulation protein YlmC with PRC-barrel domain